MTAPEIPGYRIDRLLGEGGMGRVYLAEDTALGRRVAIKLVADRLAQTDEAEARFLREARAMAAVENAHIVQVYSFGEVDSRPYFVMQYVEGESLARLIRRNRRLSVNEALPILSQCVDALAAAWDKQIIHRDLKPGNILLDAKGQVRVADFGLAKGLQLEGPAGLTHTGRMLGTPHYVSPEQAQGEGVDLRSDIYSLGIVLFEMLTGDVPFRGTTPLAVIAQHLQEPLPSLRVLRPEIPEEVESLVEWMTAKSPHDRPPSYEELRKAIGTPREAGRPIVVEPRAPLSRPPPFFEEEERIQVDAPVFVAREAELAKLEALLQATLAGRGRVAFVTGEAGTGKTALTNEFLRRAQESHADLVVASGICDANTGIGDPYAPFRQVLGLLTGDIEARWRAGTVTNEHARRLWRLVPSTVRALVTAGPDLVGTLLSGPALLKRAEVAVPADLIGRLRNLVERRAIPSPANGLQQSALFEQYTKVLQALAEHRPLVLVVDDLQWADAGSVSLFFSLGRQCVGSRMLVVGVYRSDEVALGRGGERHPLEPVVNEIKRTHGDVEARLGQAGDRVFVDAFLDSEANRLGASFREALFRRTQGHPLFTVELLRSMQDRGLLIRGAEGVWIEGPELDWDALPARVEGVIEERIGRLPERLRELMNLASVEGEDFTAEVLARVQEVDIREMVRLLSRDLEKRHHLVTAQGIRRIEGRRLSLYRFGHNLFQRYLYDSLDEVERALVHEDVGTALESLYGDQTPEIAVQLARHFEEAGITDKAIEYLRQAGEQAVRMSANQEAVAHLNRGLELLGTLPESPERSQLELALLLGLNAPVVASKGWAAPELERINTRAHELCQQLGDTVELYPQLFQALWQLWGWRSVRAEYQVAPELREQVISIAESLGDPLPLAVLEWGLGWVASHLGQLESARVSFERVFTLYDQEKHGAAAFAFGHDPRVAGHASLARTLQLLGYPEQASTRARHALALAEELGHTNTQAFALKEAAAIRLAGGDVSAAKENIEELVRLAAEERLPLYRIVAELYLGWVHCHEGRPEQGVASMRHALDGVRVIGFDAEHTQFSALLVEAYGRAGQTEEALAAVNEALEFAERTGEVYYEPELLRLKGGLFLERDEAGAQMCFQQALDVARQQRARSWELRAATSLARLWQRQGKREEAKKLLAEVHDWFTEGFDSADMKAAKTLLEELAG